MDKGVGSKQQHYRAQCDAGPGECNDSQQDRNDPADHRRPPAKLESEKAINTLQSGLVSLYRETWGPGMSMSMGYEPLP